MERKWSCLCNTQLVCDESEPDGCARLLDVDGDMEQHRHIRCTTTRRRKISDNILKAAMKCFEIRAESVSNVLKCNLPHFGCLGTPTEAELTDTEVFHFLGLLDDGDVSKGEVDEKEEGTDRGQLLCKFLRSELKWQLGF